MSIKDRIERLTCNGFRAQALCGPDFYFQERITPERVFQSAVLYCPEDLAGSFCAQSPKHGE
jgi:hypothetical protein